MSTALPSVTLSGPPSAPPESWALARGAALRVARPLGHFLHVQASSGIALVAAAAVALAWANSPWFASYEHLWHTPVGLRLGGFAVEHPLHFWVNDVLMVIFFFVVGLEIRREIHEGELSELRRAALPLVAALGGMVAPAACYFAVAGGTSVSHGWAVPTATDIAFAVGVFALLGKRVPAALRVLLLALAIIDDIGAIVIIAIFYSSGVAASGLALACAGVLGIFALQRVGVRRPVAYVVPGVVVWLGMLRSGVHPTIAGVIVGLLTPARSWYGEAGFLKVTSRSLDAIRARGTSALNEELHRVEIAQREAQAPVVRLTEALHPWVAFGIMPIFALANAGVRVGGLEVGADATTIGLGVVAGLLVGKPLGIFGASWLSVRLGVCSLPRGVGWKGVFVLALAAGIGFTMAIFVAGLAFATPANLAAAKLAVLCGSVLAGLGALACGIALLPASGHPDVAHVTVDDAERSTEY